MTQLNTDASIPAMTAELMVAIGRIEEKLTRMENLEARMTTVESVVATLEATKPVRTPLVNIIGAIAGSVAIILGVANLTVIQENKTSQAIQLEVLKKNQDQLLEKVNP